nr:hypothetical protein [Microbacterium luteolum]
MAANNPATPITPSSSACRSSGHRAGSGAPVVSSVSRRTTFDALITRAAPTESVRSALWTSSFVDRHPNL